MTSIRRRLAVTVLLHSPLFPAKNLCGEKDIRNGACWQKVIESLNAAAPEDFHPSLAAIDATTI